jgi:hypothetical protein
MPEPHLRLLRVDAAVKQRRRAGVPERVEARPRHAGPPRRRPEHTAPEVVGVKHGSRRRSQRATDSPSGTAARSGASDAASGCTLTIRWRRSRTRSRSSTPQSTTSPSSLREPPATPRGSGRSRPASPLRERSSRSCRPAGSCRGPARLPARGRDSAGGTRGPWRLRLGECPVEGTTRRRGGAPPYGTGIQRGDHGCGRRSVNLLRRGVRQLSARRRRGHRLQSRSEPTPDRTVRPPGERRELRLRIRLLPQLPEAARKVSGLCSDIRDSTRLRLRSTA